MTGSGWNLRRTASRILLGIAIVTTFLAAVLEWTGGFSIRVYGIRVSAHGTLRPILFALLCAIASVRLLDPAAQDALFERAFRVSRRLLPLLTSAMAACVLALGLAYGTHAVGGSDPYGYISQAQLWRTGDLRFHQDFVASFPWPNADWSFTPLGYRPSANHTLVPTYAPGLPLLMALFTSVAGNCGPFIVNPICGALLVILTYCIGARVSGRAVGAAAALCVATSPTVLFMTLWPMSDVPVATFWAASLLLACGGSQVRLKPDTTEACGGSQVRLKPDTTEVGGRSQVRLKPDTTEACGGSRVRLKPDTTEVCGGSRVRLKPDTTEVGDARIPVVSAFRRTLVAIAGSGAAAGAAILIRPNLAPLAIVPAVIAIWPVTGANKWRAIGGLAVFGLASAPFVLFVAWFYNNLHGSPLQSGYGDTASLFAWGNLHPNLARYPRWLWDTQGPLVFLFLLSPFLPPRPAPSSRPLRWLFMVFIAAVLASYVWYLPFDAWWFLRFLLPAMTLVFVLAGDVVWQGSRRFGAHARVLALIAFTIITVDYGVTRTKERDVFGIVRHEQKYADVGRYIAAQLPANAVVLTMQHSGSVRYYAGRPTLRYDVLDPDWLDRALAHLKASGYEPYVLLEKWEVPLFRKRFAAEKSVTIVDGPPIAQHPAHDVMLYRTDTNSSLGEPDRIPVTSGCVSR